MPRKGLMDGARAPAWGPLPIEPAEEDSVFMRWLSQEVYSSARSVNVTTSVTDYGAWAHGYRELTLRTGYNPTDSWVSATAIETETRCQAVMRRSSAV